MCSFSSSALSPSLPLSHNTGWPRTTIQFHCLALKIHRSFPLVCQATHTHTSGQESPPADQGILDAQGQGTMFGRRRWWGATLLSVAGDPTLSPDSSFSKSPPTCALPPPHTESAPPRPLLTFYTHRHNTHIQRGNIYSLLH